MNGLGGSGATPVCGVMAQELPLLKDTLRKLQVMVHPDKFGQHPHASDANTQSLAALQVTGRRPRRTDSDWHAESCCMS